jgi:hypothetical protein
MIVAGLLPPFFADTCSSCAIVKMDNLEKVGHLHGALALSAQASPARNSLSVRESLRQTGRKTFLVSL